MISEAALREKNEDNAWLPLLNNFGHVEVLCVITYMKKHLF